MSEQEALPRFDIRITPVGNNLKGEIAVPGTGFRIDVWDDHWEQHFTPQGQAYAAESTAKKIENTAKYAYAFQQFLKWWKAFDTCQECDFSRQTTVSGTTNNEMFRLRKRLFGDAISIVQQDSDEIEYEIDLQKLSTDSSIQTQLDRLAQRHSHQ